MLAREREQLFSYVTHCINLIHIALVFVKIYHRANEPACTRTALICKMKYVI